ncbi:MAG: acetyl-CoA carboxylase biotin carboxylase subunit, partial [Blastocatellia bacterium]
LMVRHRDRELAIARMKRALASAIVEGIETSIPLHQRILEEADFVAGDLSTRFMDRFEKKRGGSAVATPSISAVV